jgi:hypothetical protein
MYYKLYLSLMSFAVIFLLREGGVLILLPQENITQSVYLIDFSKC